MEEINAVNDAQVEVVEPQGNAECEEQEVAACLQTPEQNSAFATMRRRLEQAENKVTEMTQSTGSEDDATAVFDSDLEQIKQSYPDCNANSVFELSDTYARLRANGIDNLTAYRVAIAEQDSLPPETGKISAQGEQRSYYTNDELDRLTPSQLDNPKILERAMNSLLHLKKG